MKQYSQRVLLVDGSVDERQMYAEYLQSRGFCTLQVDNAEDGFRMASEMAPAVIIIALTRPGVENGLALTSRLKQHDETKNAAVIVLTNAGFDHDRHLAAKAGCDRFVTMPCLPDALAAVVDEILNERLAAQPSG